MGFLITVKLFLFHLYLYHVDTKFQIHSLIHFDVVTQNDNKLKPSDTEVGMFLEIKTKTTAENHLAIVLYSLKSYTGSRTNEIMIELLHVVVLGFNFGPLHLRDSGGQRATHSTIRPWPLC